MLSTNSFFSYETTFSIQHEDHLEDFWAYLIFKLNLEKSEAVYDRFARLYNLMYEYKKMLQNDNQIVIRLQESAEKYCLTFHTSLNSLIATIIRRLESLQFPYHYENGILRYSIEKKISKTALVQSSSLRVYDFIDREDLLQMHDILEKMQEKTYEKVFNHFTLQELNDYRTTFSYYASFLKYYPQLHGIANIVAELAVLLSLYPEKCIEVGNHIRVFLRSFINNLYHWQEKHFIHGTEEENFMFDSFHADLAQIKITLELYDDIDTQTDDLDDIFNF